VLASAPQPWAETAQSARVSLAGRELGVIGQVSRALTHALDIEQGVWFAELSIDEMLRAKRSASAVIAPPIFPPVKRDISIIVDERTLCAEVDRAIRETAGKLTSRVELIDRYTARQLPEGKYSLTFAIEYRDPSRTLTAAEVDGVHQRIGQELVRRFSATLR
jgi:phenylalanyl-tRNA synthetase beta chain